MQEKEYKQLVDSIPIFFTRNTSGYDGEYVAEGSRRDLYITIKYIEDTILRVEFKDQAVTSGYWHDNPNYPFADYITKNIIIDQPSEIERLAESLEITHLTPYALLTEMKALFSTIDDISFFLNLNGIKYEENDKL